MRIICKTGSGKAFIRMIPPILLTFVDIEQYLPTMVFKGNLDAEEEKAPIV